ncbi:MAG TPA: Gfo/Idh/MocA family oxidoreductase [Oscillospiraceae bacterium]|nr:Gfo/Idh/MocA family oxidoreductase [Oscillospiraceae bacterium]HPS35638.1 Gfo/Idh/MocA family oxidoreductase [Oscillospiraceae bacterium]
MKKIKAVLIGAGSRSTAYGPYAINQPDELQFVAVAEPDAERRNRFADIHGIPEQLRFSDYKELLGRELLGDAAVICTHDKLHFDPAVKALEKGYHVLLEKPMAATPSECMLLAEAAEEYDRVFSICHVLRYTDFFGTIKKLLDDGRIGKLISIQHNENVAFWHQAHGFVRGGFRNSDESSPMILSKCCHDMDIMLWLAGDDCVRLSSFGTLSHFKPENAPVGAPARCLDGCPVEKECPYYAPKQYLSVNTGWPTSAICNDMSIEGRTKALREGPYGRCVYHCDNNVVDHQVVNLEFANEVTAAFTMCAFTYECNRTIKLMGTKGEIRGSMLKNEIEIHNFTGEHEIINLQQSQYGHGGGDFGLMRDFLRLVQGDGEAEGLTSVKKSVQSHIMSFAAEKARLEGTVINIKEYIESVKNN